MSKLITCIFLLTTCFTTVSCLEQDGASQSESEEVSVMNGEMDKSDSCVITCPHCGFAKKEILPTEVCQIKYTCSSCNQVLTPQGDDCCVYCSYGTHKCPSKQK
jgi:hypothetical protein